MSFILPSLIEKTNNCLIEKEKKPKKVGLCKVRMRTADADGGCGRRTADGGRRTDKKKKKIIEKKNDMKNNKLIIKIVGQLMPFK